MRCKQVLFVFDMVSAGVLNSRLQNRTQITQEWHNQFSMNTMATNCSFNKQFGSEETNHTVTCALTCLPFFLHLCLH